MVADVNFPKVERQSDDEAKHRQEIARALNTTIDGKLNSALSFALEVSPAVSTTISDPRIAPTSRVLLQPVNDAAVADYAAGAVKVVSTTNGQFVVEHTQFGIARTFKCSFLS